MIIGKHSLSLNEILKVATEYERIELDPSCKTRVQKSVDYLNFAINKVFSDNSTTNREDYFIYGVSTGFGEFKKKKLNKKQQLIEIQKNIIKSHSVGVGNYLPEEVVRTVILLRINTFLKGYSAVRFELIEKLCELLNKKIYPLAPEKGSVGASGDLAPLAHIFAPLIGKGKIRIKQDVEYNGITIQKGDYETSEIIKKGYFEPLELSYKEGLALTNGTTVSTSIGIFELNKILNLLKFADIAGALSLESIMGCTRAFDLNVNRLKNLKGQIKTAENILKLIDGSKLVNLSGEIQDLYSIRCIPQVHGASKDTVFFTADIILNEANAVTDNPLFIVDDDYIPFDNKGHIKHYSAGNFHGQSIAIAMDYLAIAVSELGNISERRTQMLLDKNYNMGLNSCLAVNPGVDSGLMMAQYTAASLVSENKTLVHPASCDSIPTSSNTEDHVSMSNWAARKLRTIVENVQYIIAIELLSTIQALNFRTGILGEKFYKGTPGKGTKLIFNELSKKIKPITEDREFYLDIEKIYRLINSNEIVSKLENHLKYKLL